MLLKIVVLVEVDELCMMVCHMTQSKVQVMKLLKFEILTFFIYFAI